MRLYWSFSGLDKSEEHRVEELWHQRQLALKSMVGIEGEAPSAQARFLIEHHDDATPPWTAQLAVYLPSAVHFAEAEGETVEAVFDELLAELSQRIDQYQAQPPARLEVGRRDLQQLSGQLAALHAAGRSREFMDLLIPVVGSLARYAKSELISRHRQEELPAGRINVWDVLDETTLRAWERFASRPADQPLDLWLIQQMDQVIDEACRPIAQVSLEDRWALIEDGSPRDAVRSQWTEHATEFETIELAQLLPDEPGMVALNELDVETKQVRLDDLFGHLTRLQRQVIMLHAVEGFDLAEIADFQDRTVEEVETDLRDAQSIIRRMSQEQGLMDLEEDLERESLERPRRSH